MAETKERRKTPRKAATATPKPDSKAAAPRKPVTESSVQTGLSPEEARQLIAEAAYFRAKQRGFEPGHELEDWVQAESEVLSRLNGRAA